MRQPGEWIHGKYQVERVLGSGGMGVVYATKRRNESRAAVKVLHPRFARDKTVRARFVEEGYLANRVGHPAVVTILEDDIDESGNFYLVMEQLDGVDLGKFVGPGHPPIQVAQALNIAEQLLSALIQAHKKGIVHRDIKPANVMLLRDGRLKLLDFGIAQALGGESGGSELDDEDEEDRILGTDAYMAPEQGNGFRDEIDARTDIWAVGALLMALLAEEEPSAVPLWDQSYEERAWSFSRLGERVPPHVVQILSLALQPQKTRRWASAATMKGAVETAHLDLYGPFDRTPLVSLVATELGASPEETIHDEAAPLELSAPLDPTAVSRRSPLPRRARSSSAPDLAQEEDADSRASRRSLSGEEERGSSSASRVPTRPFLGSRRGTMMAAGASVVVLFAGVGFWLLKSDPVTRTMPSTLGTATAVKELDPPSEGRESPGLSERTQEEITEGAEVVPRPSPSPEAPPPRPSPPLKPSPSPKPGVGGSTEPRPPRPSPEESNVVGKGDGQGTETGTTPLPPKSPSSRQLKPFEIKKLEK